MELVKNRASGKFFVLLDDDGGPNFLVITPEGKILLLERRLFIPQGISDPGEALSKRLVTKTQADLHAEYYGT